MRVVEIFGPTIQGEGPHAGELVGFLRLADCNLSCSWCDTRYSWDWSVFDKDTESSEMNPVGVRGRLKDMNVERVIITGGEPMMQQDDFPVLESNLYKIDVETNGTIKPKQETVDAVDLFVVSPKLSNSGDRLRMRIKPDVLQAYADTGKAVFKFVASSIADLDEVTALALPNVWIMPEGADRVTHLNNLIELADAVVARGWNLSSRLHVLAWDVRRGV